MNNLIKIKELAVLLGVTERWIYQLQRDGVIKTCDPMGCLFDVEVTKQAYLDYKLRKLKAKGLL
jgi:hypothetical protein